LVGLVTVALAGAVGFCLFKLVSPKGVATSPVGVGRKWFAWVIFAGTLTLLPKFFRKLDADSFAMWLIGVVIYGGLAFFFGWIYGLFRFRGRQVAVGAPPVIQPSPVPAPLTSAHNTATPPLLPSERSSSTTPPQLPPPPPIDGSNDAPARLARLKELSDRGLISRDEYDSKRQEILAQLC
jgi:hypothetical protein